MGVLPGVVDNVQPSADLSTRTREETSNTHEYISNSNVATNNVLHVLLTT